MQSFRISSAVACLGLICSTVVHSTFIYNRAQVQRGADVFMLHCSGCHSLRYVRYAHLSNDLGISSRVYDPVLSSLSAAQAVSWFGRVPPDLSMVSAEKGQSWLAKYLNSFYKDQGRPFGVNNYITPGVLMPDVFSENSYDEKQKLIQDLLAFLDYTAKPERGLSYVTGAGVLVFLLLFIWALALSTSSP